MSRTSLALAAAILLPLPAAHAQAHYDAAFQAGSAFMLDLDNADPPGSWSFSAALGRRYAGRTVSLGLEAGFHRFMAF